MLILKCSFSTVLSVLLPEIEKVLNRLIFLSTFEILKGDVVCSMVHLRRAVTTNVILQRLDLSNMLCLGIYVYWHLRM